MKKIERICAFDMDGTIMNTISPEEGIPIWEKVTGKKYPHKNKDWWHKPESLDLEVFDIQPFPTIYNQFKHELATPNTLVFILTSRTEKLRPQVQAIMDKHNMNVEFEMYNNDGRNKGDKIIELIDWYPDLEEICVYDDRQKELDIYKGIINKIPENITFNIYQVTDDKLSLLKETVNKLRSIITEELQNFFNCIYNKK